MMFSMLARPGNPGRMAAPNGYFVMISWIAMMLFEGDVKE
jgi:hypothetical protein